MAEIAISLFVSTVAERLSKYLINEALLLREVASEVEWIERELRHMQAFLEHVERSGQSEEEGVNEWAEQLKDVARDAEDVIETFVIKSLKRKRNWVLYLVDRYSVGKELEQIRQRMRDMSQKRMNFEQTNIGVVVEASAQEETSASASPTTPNAMVAPAVEKLSYILTQNLVPSKKMIKIVEKVRDEVVGLQNVVSNLESTRESSERETVWLEEVKGVCDFTLHVAEDFITGRGRRLRMGRLKRVLCRYGGYDLERKLGKEMKYVRTQIGDALDRRLTYGVGEEEFGGREEHRIGSRSSVVPSLSLERLLIPKLPFLILYIAIFPFLTVGLPVYLVILLCSVILLVVTQPTTVVRLWKANEKKKKVWLKTLLFNTSIDFVISFLSQFVPLWAVFLLEFYSILYAVIVWSVSLWRSADKNLVSIQRDLALMLAFFRDTARAEGLNERQTVWLEQTRVVAQHAEALLAEYELGMDQHTKKGVFRRLFLLKFAKKINRVLHKIHVNSERKTIYVIANIEGRKCLVSLGEITQGTGSEIQTVVEHNDNSGREEHPHLPAGSLQDISHEYRPVKGLKEKVQLIREDMQLMNALFEDVQAMGELDRRSQIWVEQMRGIALETASVIDDYANKLEHKPMHIHILHPPLRHVTKIKINKIRNKIEDASRRRQTYGLVQLQTRAESSSMVQRLRRRTQRSLIVKGSIIIGFDEDVEVVMAQLLSNEERRCITSIIGIGGTGKTALAWLIFNNNAVIDHFHYRVWVSVPQNCTVEWLLDDIAKQIMGEQEDRWTAEEDLTQGLKTFLANKRYLIVIDGIQTSQVWDSLKKTIPDMSTGCRLLLTSRNPQVELHPGSRTFVHQLQLLDDENSWVLFTRNLNVDIPPELMKIGNEIVIKCGGLPSEILKMGNLLSQKDITNEEWSRVLEQLNQDQKPWFETLETINLNLPLYLRRCLFYFVLFPAEFGIPARRLVVLWVAEGLVHHGENEEPPEHVAERYLTELIDLNMVQIAKRKHNGKVKTCRLPNALRELWLTKANESKFLQGHNDTDSIIRRVADHLDKNDICYNHIHSDTKSDSASMRTYYKEVLSFVSFDTQEGSKPGEDIGNFLNRCIFSSCFLLLRVLDLERVYKPQLPKSIGRLSRLRYLGLRWTYLESLPSSISNLLKLQTLDLKHTYIHTLTSSIWKMQLRHLFLSETYRSRFPPQPKGNSLFDLQTLWGLFVDEESPVKGSLDKLVNIKKLGLTCQSMSLEQEAMTSQLDAVADWILRLEHLQSLRLKSRDEEGRPWNLHLKSLQNHPYLTDIYLVGSLSSSTILSQFPPSVIELTLSHSRLQEDPMQILKDLPNLRSLCLLSESYRGKTLLCNSGSFPQLHVLKFWMLEQLEEWHIEQEALPCLRQLEIRSCGCLKMLPDGLQHVNTLLELKLTNMPIQFKSRIRDTNSEDWHKISHIPNVA